MISRCFDVMDETPQHSHQVSTKRPQRMVRFIYERYIESGRAIPPSIHLGVSVENRATLSRLDVLNRLAPAAPVLWASFEPLLEDLGDLAGYSWLDWAVFGSESGLRARPCHLEWLRQAMRQLRATRLFVKQLGQCF